MIFVTGSIHVLPWNPSAQKLLILLRMCIKTNKKVFASSLGFFCLVFLSATDIKSWSMNVVNGNGEGSSIHIDGAWYKSSGVLDSSDCFLDDSTGDYFTLNTDSREWEPVGNVGIHRRKAAEDRRIPGVQIVLPKPYRVSTVEPRRFLAQNSFDPSNEVT